MQRANNGNVLSAGIIGLVTFYLHLILTPHTLTLTLTLILIHINFALTRVPTLQLSTRGIVNKEDVNKEDCNSLNADVGHGILIDTDSRPHAHPHSNTARGKNRVSVKGMCFARAYFFTS